MKILIITLSAACAVVASYFGVHYFIRRDLGLTTAKKYVKSPTKNLLHTDRIPAREVGTTSNTPAEQAA